MKQETQLALVATGVVAASILLLRSRSIVPAAAATSTVPSQDAPHGDTTGQWSNSNAPSQIRSIAAPLEQFAHWPNLGNYLAAISYIESRGNPKAGSSAYDNAARGWFGMRPESAKTAKYGFSDPNILKDPVHAVVFAADYAKRLIPFAAEGQMIDWLAIRRGWAYPSKVDDVNDPGYKDQLATGLSKVGLPREFMYLPAFPPGFQWPGFHAALAALKVS